MLYGNDELGLIMHLPNKFTKFPNFSVQSTVMSCLMYVYNLLINVEKSNRYS